MASEIVDRLSLDGGVTASVERDGAMCVLRLRRHHTPLQESLVLAFDDLDKLTALCQRHGGVSLARRQPAPAAPAPAPREVTVRSTEPIEAMPVVAPVVHRPKPKPTPDMFPVEDQRKLDSVKVAVELLIEKAAGHRLRKLTGMAIVFNPDGGVGLVVHRKVEPTCQFVFTADELRSCAATDRVGGDQ
jgi:hypothetical protein